MASFCEEKYYKKYKSEEKLCDAKGVTIFENVPETFFSNEFR